MAWLVPWPAGTSTETAFMAGMPDASWAAVAPAVHQPKPGGGGESVSNEHAQLVPCPAGTSTEKTFMAGMPDASCAGVAPAAHDGREWQR